MIKVSVIMITYNHEKFIREAIESVLMQQVNFQVELIIADDKSPDNTESVVKDIISTHPKSHWIKYTKHAVNKGPNQNFTWATREVKGDYIALCEGDDYWTDPLKLQKQVDFLESNPEYNLVTTYVRQYFQEKDAFIDPRAIITYSFDYKDLIVRNHCSTCATMIRNFINKEGLQFMDNMGTDSQLWIRALGKNGKGKCLDSVTAVYRLHSLGISNIYKLKRNSYSKKIASMRQKISKANLWNDYYNNEAQKSVLLVKERVLKRTIRLSYQEKKFFSIPIDFLDLLRTKISLFFYK